MLTSAQSIVAYDFARKTVVPDRLTRTAHAHYVRAAESMLSVYRRGVGETRQTLHRRVESILGRLDDCPPRRAAAFCKLLDDRSTYRSGRSGAATLRSRVFTEAAKLHPIVSRPQTLVECELTQARRQIAESLGTNWEQIEASLFSDVIELQTLDSFPPTETFGAADLLSAYNVGQTQAALYRGIKLTVSATHDIKTIVRHAKLAGLMHRVTRHQDRAGRPVYRFEFDGPASSLRQTWRYGLRFAKFLPMLLACRGWRMSAEVLGPGPGGKRDRVYRLELSPESGLKSPHSPPEEFDSGQEKAIHDAWQADPPAGWTLERESEILVAGQRVLTPDFVLRGDDRPSDPVYVELLGYWTPEYLEEKASRLGQFSDRRWIVIVPPSRRHRVPAGLAAIEWSGSFDPRRLVEIASQSFHPPRRDR